MARSRRPSRQQPQAARQSTGLPPGLKLYTPFPFRGMQVRSSVIAIDDDQFAWVENCIIHGKGQIALGLSNNPTPLYTTVGGRTIISFQNAQRASVNYVVILLSDGSAVAVRIDNGGVTGIAAAATFDTTGPLAVASWGGGSTVSGTSYILLANKFAYYAWDGINLFAPGTLAPQVTITNSGFNYGSAPTVTISGGSGAGATATAVIDSTGAVVGVTITNPGTGYIASDGARVKAVFTGGGQTIKVAQGHATIGGGGVLSVTMVDGGTGYTNNPAVTFAGGGAGTQATGVALGNANSITQVLVVTPGVGYTSTPTVAFAAPAGGGNTATGFVNIGYNGITAVTVDDGGSGYTSSPTVVAIDPFGNGTGFKGVAIMNGGVVIGVNVTNPGYGYIDAVITFVGGNPGVAAATITLMPQGGQQPVSGTAIQVFKSHVWMINGIYRYTSAAGSLSNFSASAGGIISQNTDSNLIFNLFGLAQTSSFLYEFGDSSINSISNPQTSTVESGSSATATIVYTITNVDSQVGCIWPGTIQLFGQSIIFATSYGIFAVVGGSVRKISTDLDDLFSLLPDQGGITPSAGIFIMFGIKFYALTIIITDPIQNANRRVMLLWDGANWFAATQDANIISLITTAIGGVTFTVFSGQNCFGLDNLKQHIYQCFVTNSNTLTKKVISKFYGVESAQQFKQVLRWYFSAEQPITYDVVVHTEVADVDLGSVTYPDSAGPSVNNAYGGRLTVQGRDGQGVNGRFLGWTLTTTASGGFIDYMALAYVDYSGYYS